MATEVVKKASAPLAWTMNKHLHLILCIGFCQNDPDHDTYLQLDAYELRQGTQPNQVKIIAQQ